MLKNPVLLCYQIIIIFLIVFEYIDLNQTYKFLSHNFKNKIKLLLIPLKYYKCKIMTQNWKLVWLPISHIQIYLKNFNKNSFNYSIQFKQVLSENLLEALLR